MKPALVALLFAVAPAHAALYQCDENGRKVFQDRPCIGGKKIDASPANQSVKPVAPIDYSRELRKLKAKEEAEEREVEAERHRALVAHELREERCRQIRDEAEREAAWYSSISEAVRQSAFVKIRQLEERSREMNCTPWPRR